MKSLIEQAREAVARHALAELSKHDDAEKRRQETEAAKLTLIANWADNAMLDCRANILRRAAEGITTYRRTVTSFEPRVSESTIARANALTALLKQEGFTVTSHESREDPVGSDPLFSTTVYATYLDISWA